MPPPQPAGTVPNRRQDRVLQSAGGVPASADGAPRSPAVNALIQKKPDENADKAKLLQGNQQKLQTSGSVMNETPAFSSRRKSRSRPRTRAVPAGRAGRINELQQEVQNEFVKSCRRSSSSSRSRRRSAPRVQRLGVRYCLGGARPGPDGRFIKKLDALVKPATGNDTRRAKAEG